MGFELLEQTKKHYGTTLHRLKYDDGTIGGWAESRDNIEDDARVTGDAVVRGGAIVTGDAVVRGGAIVTGDARVKGGAIVTGDARVKGQAVVEGGAVVRGDAVVKGDACVEGQAFVTGDARVERDARVTGGAVVKGRSLVTGDATVEGQAFVTGYALVKGDAFVTGDAVVRGNAVVKGDARVTGGAVVKGRSLVIGDARVRGRAVVEKNHKIVSGTVDGSFADGESTREQLRRQLGVDAINGEALLWKKARSTDEEGVYESCYDSDFEYRVGEEAVCDDPDMSDASCSRGLHVGNPYYGDGGDTVLACRVDLDDIITVQDGKARVERLRVVDAVEQNSDDSEEELEER